jgi:S-formylglutathione hydrolase FrmB
MRPVLVTLGVLLVAAAVYTPIRNKVRGYSSTHGATVERFTVHSKEVRRDLHEILVHPKATRSTTMLVFLHGRGGGPASNLSQQLFDGLRELGPRAPYVLLLDGGEHSYWHDRRDGSWGTMVLREAIPAGVARTHARKIAIGGISMGGFGALDLGGRAQFCAVGAHSAALWFRGGDTAPGAFDDAEDFARHDLVAHPPHYTGRVWMDVGTDDPFRAADEALARKLGVRIDVWPGGHGGWEQHMKRYLRFYVDACS